MASRRLGMRRRNFIAFSRAEASLLALPARQEGTPPATAAGTFRRQASHCRHRDGPRPRPAPRRPKPGSTMFGLRINASRTTDCVRSSSNTIPSTAPLTSSHRAIVCVPTISTSGSTMGTNPRLLAKRGVARQAPARWREYRRGWAVRSQTDHCAPFGEAGAHAGIGPQGACAIRPGPRATVSPGMQRQVLRAEIYLDASDDAGIKQPPRQAKCRAGHACRMVSSYRRITPADVIAQARRRHDQLAVSAARLDSLRDAGVGEALVAGGATFIHRQQPLPGADQAPGHVSRAWCVMTPAPTASREFRAGPRRACRCSACARPGCLPAPAASDRRLRCPDRR